MPDLSAEIDSSRPHAARMYDYFIGGKNHFAADREAAAEVVRKSPPGIVLVSEWRPDDAGPRPTPAEVNCYGGVARKP